MVCGASCTGKTTFALRYLLNGPAHFKFVFDPSGDFARLMHCRPAETAAACQWQLANSGWCLFDPERMFPGDYGAGLAWFAAWAWECGQSLAGQSIFLVDEITRWGVDPWTCPPALVTLAQAGRKRNFGFLWTTHEPNRVNGALVGQLTEIVAFQTIFIPALQMLAQYRLDPDALPHLPTGHWRAVNLQNGATLDGNLF
jgi:hypothetical protein